MLGGTSALLKLDERLPMRRQHLGKEAMSDLPRTPAPLPSRAMSNTMSNEGIDRLLADITSPAGAWIDMRATLLPQPD
jgi:hypothetical protein